MPDREKVINGLREMSCRCTWKDIDRIRDKFQPVVNGAIELLKEREHTKPYRPEELWLCKKCDQTIGWDDVLGIEDTLYNYCPNCGRVVDWDEELPWLKENERKKTNMNDNELKMESCSHVWIYDHTDHDTVYMRCPYCNMVRMAMPGEPCHVVSKELNIRHDDKDGDV